MFRILASALMLAFAAVPANAGHAPQPPADAAPASPNLFIVVYRPGPAWQAGRPMSEQGLAPHGRFYRGLLDDGRLFAGGGFTSSDGGLAILRLPDLEAARALVASDPAVTSGIFVAQVEQWRPRFQVADPLPAPPRVPAGAQ